MPVEVLIQAGRNLVRMHDADKSITVIALDDATSNAYGATDVNRRVVANGVNRLFAMHVRRVYFDRLYNAPSAVDADDKLLAQTLAHYPGRVFLGTALEVPDVGKPRVYKPVNVLARAASLVSLDADNLAGLSINLYYRWRFPTGEISTISASLADVDGAANDHYRPDYAIRARSIPTYSFLDLINSRIPAQAVAGKDVVIGPTAIIYHDTHLIVGQGWLPGVYSHVIGAQTLKGGRPIDWGRIPSMVIATLLGAFHLWSRRQVARRRVAATAALLLIAVPIGLDALHISVDVFPGLVIFGILFLRGNALRMREHASLEAYGRNEATGLANVHALQNTQRTIDKTLIALKLINHAEVISTFDDRIDAELADAIKRRVTLGTPDDHLYQGDGMLYWFTEMEMGGGLAVHLQGLQAILERTITIQDRKIDLAVSFGVDSDYDRPISARVASATLCADEASQYDQVYKFYDPDRRLQTIEQLRLVASLDDAIDGRELYLLYQPKYALTTGRMVGVEALVRWNHPVLGDLKPDSFIILAEKSHRITRLTQFVISEAIQATAPLMVSAKYFSVAINVSPQLLINSTFPDLVSSLCEKYMVDPGNVTLEITETIELDWSGCALETLHTLRDRGFGISIDDYGTGSATLDYLRRIPATEVKLDRSFIADIDTNPINRSLVAGTIRTVHELSRIVVAEGIETNVIATTLQALGCDVAQGYVFGKPMGIEAIELLLKVEHEQRELRRHFGY